MSASNTVTLGSVEVDKLFPRFWLSGKMTSDEVQDLCNVTFQDGPPSTQSVIGIGWTPERTARFIENSTSELTRPESWRPIADAWIMSLHRTDLPAADSPLGFVGFRSKIEFDPNGGPCLQFLLYLDLCWVAPPLRRRGYGLHLAAHVIRYLETYPVPANHFGNALKGLDVTIIRDRVAACRWLASKLVHSLELDRSLASQADAEGLPMPAWPILRVDVEDAE